MAEHSAENEDPRECGWMGCGHPRCVELCMAVPLPEWREWRASRTGTSPSPGGDS